MRVLSRRGAFALSLAATLSFACDRRSTPAPPTDAEAKAEAAAASVPASVARPPGNAPADAARGGLLARKLPRMEYRGGPILRHPRITTITFRRDDPKLVTRLEALGASVTKLAWWKTVTEGYCIADGDCIGEGAAAPPVHLDDALGAKVTDADVDALLVRAAKSKRLGVLDDNALFVVYLPAGVTLSDASVPAYCAENAPRAFHRAIELEGKRVAIAVVPRCGDEALTTGTASHEILESTTNPFPAQRGFAFVGGSGPSGFSAAGFEPVDPCGLVMMDAHTTSEASFTLHRAWSNARAAGGHEPCVPAPDRPYVMLVPREPAVRAAREGETISVDLDATGDRDTPAWAVTAFDLTGRHDHTAYVDVALDTTTAKRGDHVKLSITTRKRAPSQRAVVAVMSTLDGVSHMWPLAVTMR